MHERRDGIDTQLLHDPGPMNLDGVLARAKLVGDLLVEESASDEIADLTLAPRQLREPFGGVPPGLFLQLLCDGPCLRTRQSFEQLWLVDRFDEKIQGTLAHRAGGRRHVASPA